jgi:hypothetical protein
VPAGGELAPERDRGEGVAGIAEGREQDAARRPVDAQSISASWRTIRLRSSASNAIGDTISVPTPASR